MSARGLVHDDTFIFDGTNYDIWRIHMLTHFRVMDPNIEQIVDMGFSPPKDATNLSLEDEKNSYLNAQAINVLSNFVSIVVVMSIMPFWNAHEFWTKLQEKYDVSKFIEDECIPSTSGRDELSSTSAMCCKTQGNDMVSGDGNCNVDSKLNFDDHSSLSYGNVLSLDLNSSSIPIVLHASVDSPCMSWSSCYTRYNDKNAPISFGTFVANNVEESQLLSEQDMDLNGASSNSSFGSHICLMARDSNVTPSLKPTISSDNEEEDDDVASLRKKGEIVFQAIGKKKIACSNFVEILVVSIESKKIIDELQSHDEE
jgi:hypothetical protein